MAYEDTYTVSFPVVAAAGTDSVEVACLPSTLTGTYVLKSADLVVAVATAAHATNVAVITLYGADADGAQGGTAQASWDTTTGQDGALAAGDVQALTLTGGSNADFEGGDLIEVFVDESGGTGAAIDCTMVLSFEKRR